MKMKKSYFSLGAILLAGCLVTQSGIEKAVAESGSDIFGLELHYFESAFQCDSDSTQADIKVNVYDQNNNLLTTMSKGDKYLSTDIDSVNDLEFEYEIYNLSCITEGSSLPALGTELLGSNDTLPNVGGFSGQSSIVQMLNGFDKYKELYLVELGTSDSDSSAYDLQDVVLVVDNDPNAAPIAQNDTATTSILNTITIDVLANDIEPDGDVKSIASIDSIFGGNAVVEDNKIIYTAGSMIGEFSLTYTLQDDYGKSDSGTEVINVTGYPD